MNPRFEARPDDARLGSSNGEEGPPTKAERLNAILKIVAESAPAKSAREANDLLLNAFKEVEVEVPRGERMFVFSIDSYLKMFRGDKIIHYEIYNRYILFLGDNGSIDIRVNKGVIFTEALFAEDPQYIKKNVELFFEKAGADGRKVWD